VVLREVSVVIVVGMDLLGYNRNSGRCGEQSESAECGAHGGGTPSFHWTREEASWVTADSRYLR
jgi:hypothetical protein